MTSIRLIPFFVFALAAPAAVVALDAPVQLSPVKVTRAPLGLVGIRLKIDAPSAEPQARINRTQIVGVVPGSSAARAGLQAGDEVLQIDGQPMHGMTVGGLKDLLNAKSAGDTLVLQYRRRGVMQTAVLRLEP